MKAVVLFFGALGFAIVALSGASADRPADLVLRDAALACLATAFVGRWFWQTCQRAFAETVAARRAAAEAAAAAEEAAAAAAKAAAKAQAAAPAPAAAKNSQTVPASPAKRPAAAPAAPAASR